MGYVGGDGGGGTLSNSTCFGEYIIGLCLHGILRTEKVKR